MTYKMFTSLHNIIVTYKTNSILHPTFCNMSFFYHEVPPDSFSKKYKFLTATLKDAFFNCHIFGGRISSSDSEEDGLGSDIDDDQEVVVSEIRSRAMEAKARRKASFTMDSYCWVLSSPTGDLFITPKAVQQKENSDDEGKEKEDYSSVNSYFSRCSSATSMMAFHSVKTNLSRCSSLNRLDDFRGCLSLNGLNLQDSRRRSIIQELCHCKGWPFGLCRKALLLPPLPKSPSESWTWRKHGRVVKLH